MLPITQLRYTTPTLAGLGVAATAVLSVLGTAPWWVAWVVWATTGVLAVSINNILSRFAIGQHHGTATIVVAWVALMASINYIVHYLPSDAPLWFMLADVGVTLLVIAILLSSWQERTAPLSFLVVGLMMGILSTYMPNLLYRLLLLPVAAYQMRSLSLRNIASGLTGAVFGVWLVYCIAFASMGEATADGIIVSYAALADFSLPSVPQMGVQEWVFVGFYLLLMAIYSFTSVAFDVGNTLRTHSAIVLIAVVSIAAAILAACDIDDLSLYLNMLSMLLAIQLALHQSNIHTEVNEWWTVSLLATLLLLDIAPVAATMLLA